MAVSEGFFWFLKYLFIQDSSVSTHTVFLSCTQLYIHSHTQAHLRAAYFNHSFLSHFLKLLGVAFFKKTLLQVD